MNVVLLVVDSLRACSLGRGAPDAPHTPFLDRLARDTVAFRQARATECWTLPTHLSMFTGLLPSAHGAHFQSMAYAERTPTLAERFAAAGYHTEVVTRNSLFDGTIPGATRGFQRNTRLLAELRVPDPLGVLLALSKPRVRRLIQTSGFFHVLQRDNGAFLSTLARMIIPADHLVLDYTLEQMAAHRRSGKPYFLFLNLYDIHAPYPPRPHSPLRSFASLAGWIENLMLPRLSTQLGSHAYLREGFAFSPRARRILRDRYARAIEREARRLHRRGTRHGTARRHRAGGGLRPRRGLRRARALLPRRLGVRHAPARAVVDPSPRLHAAHGRRPGQHP